MCYTCVIKRAEPIGENGFNILLNLIHKEIGFNQDGYALRYDKHLIRTLNFNEFLTHILKNKEEIKKSRVINLHLRKSTNQINKKNIHLWLKGGFYCAHNGILYNTTDKNENDSLKFFNDLAEDIKKEDYNAIKKYLEENKGYGIFFLSGAEEQNADKHILISYNKPICFYKIGDIDIFSCEPISFEDFNTNLLFSIEQSQNKAEYFGFKYSNIKQIYVCLNKFKLEDVDIAECQKENIILVIKADQKEKLIKLKPQDKTNNSLNSYWGSDIKPVDGLKTEAEQEDAEEMQDYAEWLTAEENYALKKEQEQELKNTAILNRLEQTENKEHFAEPDQTREDKFNTFEDINAKKQKYINWGDY